jgi:hypothetical protein
VLYKCELGVEVWLRGLFVLCMCCIVKLPLVEYSRTVLFAFD